MKKDINYYMALDYSVEIRKLRKEEGGGYLASIPQLGSKAFCADGRTINKALEGLKQVKRLLFSDYLDRGVPIPEPEAETESLFSGKFVIRIPVTLHRELVETTRKQNISLNQLILHLLSYNTPLIALEKRLEECFSEIKYTLSNIEVTFQIAFPPTNYIPKTGKEVYASAA